MYSPIILEAPSPRSLSLSRSRCGQGSGRTPLYTSLAGGLSPPFRVLTSPPPVPWPKDTCDDMLDLQATRDNLPVSRSLI